MFLQAGVKISWGYKRQWRIKVSVTSILGILRYKCEGTPTAVSVSGGRSVVSAATVCSTKPLKSLYVQTLTNSTVLFKSQSTPSGYFACIPTIYRKYLCSVKKKIKTNRFFSVLSED